MINAASEQTSAKGPSHAHMFVWLFAIASIWHYTSSATELLRYWENFDPIVTPLIALAIITAMIVAVFPNRTPAILAFAGAQTLVIGFRFPFVADHLVMEIGLNLAILLSFAYLAIRRRSTDVSPDEMFSLYSPIGRWLLIIMYFYGTFHKINPGFMSLDSSCALPFIDGFPLPQAIIDLQISQYAAIWGTLILESVAMVLLLTTRTKYYGMLLGMSFHFLIGISSFGTLAHFSTFALALHTLFLPSSIGQQVYGTSWIPDFLKNESNFKVATIVFVLLQVFFGLHLLMTFDVYLVNSLFAIFGATLMVLVFKYGRVRSVDAPYRLKSSWLALNLIPVWFFVHCMSPYIGLGTGGALTMFSGLRTEGGISNHYLIPTPLRLFPYQDTIIYFDNASNPSLAPVVRDEQGMTMFDFQRHFMHREPLALPLTVRVDDQVYNLDDVPAIEAFAAKYFTEQSWLERKYMSFRLVDDPNPKICRH